MIPRRFEIDCALIAERFRGALRSIPQRFRSDYRALAQLTALQSDRKTILKTLQSNCKPLSV
jgi:hypothetical protein